MKDVEKNLDLLIMQRNQIIASLEKTTSTIQKVLIAIFTSTISIIVAEATGAEYSKTIILVAIQIVILLVFFIASLVVSGNMDRYYIAAIDDYIAEQYDIGVLFYKGYSSLKHKLGAAVYHEFNKNDINKTKAETEAKQNHCFLFYPLIIFIGSSFFAVNIVWLFFYIEESFFSINDCKMEKIYGLIVAIELIVLLLIFIVNFIKKFRPNNIYCDTTNYLKRNSDVDVVSTAQPEDANTKSPEQNKNK